VILTPDIRTDVQDFFLTYREDWDEFCVDLDEALEISLAHASHQKPLYLRNVATGIEQLLESYSDDWDLQTAMLHEAGASIRDTRTVRSHVERILARINTGGAYDGSVVSPSQGYPDFSLPRLPDFPDFAAGNRISTEVMRAHRHFLDDWDAHRQFRRVHLYVDLSMPTGTVTIRGTDEEVPVTAARVTMGATDAELPPLILAAYPDLSVDPSWAARFPLLPHLFGAWFGAVRQANNHSPWDAQADYITNTPEPTLAEINGQLHRLLADVSDAAQLQVALDALGSYLSPRDTRSWLARMAGRTDDYLAGDRWNWPSQWLHLEPGT
jgi:hypothetical protein